MSRQPCAGCPFLVGTRTRLRPGRADEIFWALENDGGFTCHETIDYQALREREESGSDEPTEPENGSLCVGAAIFMERAMYGMLANFVFRMAAMTGKLRPEELDLEAKVFNSKQKMRDHSIT